MRRPLLAAAALALAMASTAGCHFIVNTGDIVGRADAGPDGSASADTGAAEDAGATAGLDARFDGSLEGATVVVGAGVGGARMRNGFVSLGFDCDAACAVRDLRLANGAGDLLFHQDAGETNEQLLGISYYDQDYSWRAESGATLTLVEAGPPVAQVRLDWSSGAMSGASLYTLHPDGRLHRHETVNVTSLNSAAWLLAYTAVDRAKLPSAKVSAGDAGLVETEDTTSLERGFGCAENVSSGEAVSWAHREIAGKEMAGWRVKWVDGSVLLASDWVQDGEVGKGERRGTFVTVLGKGGCAAHAAPIAAFQDPPGLIATSGEPVTDDPSDPDTDGYAEGAGYYSFRVEDPATGLVAMLPEGQLTLPTCTLRIVTTATTQPTVVLGGQTLVPDKDYYASRGEGANRPFWVYLAVPWVAGKTLSITW